MADEAIVIPQPLVVKLEGTSQPYQNKDALIGSIAITLYCNTDFNQSPAGTEDIAKKCIVNAEALYSAAAKLGKTGYFDALLAEK